METPPGPGGAILTLSLDSGSSGYVDQTRYRCIHFHGNQLWRPLGEASLYLKELSRNCDRQPHVLGIHNDHSSEDAATELAWRVTLVIADPPYPVE